MAAAYAHLKKYARTSALYTRAAHRIDDAVELVRVPKVNGQEQPLLQPNQGTSPIVKHFLSGVGTREGERWGAWFLVLIEIESYVELHESMAEVFWEFESSVVLR